MLTPVRLGKLKKDFEVIILAVPKCPLAKETRHFGTANIVTANVPMTVKENGSNVYI
jgi:hypothetical protein